MPRNHIVVYHQKLFNFQNFGKQGTRQKGFICCPVSMVIFFFSFRSIPQKGFEEALASNYQLYLYFVSKETLCLIYFKNIFKSLNIIIPIHLCQ